MSYIANGRYSAINDIRIFCRSTQKLTERREIVMKKEAEILIQYARGDFSKRMYMFLQFPDLRDAFQEIERKGFRCSKDFCIYD